MGTLGNSPVAADAGAPDAAADAEGSCSSTKLCTLRILRLIDDGQRNHGKQHRLNKFTLRSCLYLPRMLLASNKPVLSHSAVAYLQLIMDAADCTRHSCAAAQQHLHVCTRGSAVLWLQLYMWLQRDERSSIRHADHDTCLHYGWCQRQPSLEAWLQLHAWLQLKPSLRQPYPPRLQDVAQPWPVHLQAPSLHPQQPQPPRQLQQPPLPHQHL